MRSMLHWGLLATVLVSCASAEDDMTPMVKAASEFISRATSTSEVLTLNLTNLLILLALKALIFGLGIFSVGSGRSADSSEELVTPSEMTAGMCFIMYVSQFDEQSLSCMQKTACEDPYMVSKYHYAGKLWYQMHSLMSS